MIKPRKMYYCLSFYKHTFSCKRSNTNFIINFSFLIFTVILRGFFLLCFCFFYFLEGRVVNIYTNILVFIMCSSVWHKIENSRHRALKDNFLTLYFGQMLSKQRQFWPETSRSFTACGHILHIVSVLVSLHSALNSE